MNSRPDLTRRPRVRVHVQPASGQTKYRYKNEGRTAGSIPGVGGTLENKVSPSIRIFDCQDRKVLVRVSCVTSDTPYRIHPHNIVSRDRATCQNGIYKATVDLEPDGIVTFHNLGIQCVKKNDVSESLRRRLELGVNPFGENLNVNDNHKFNLKTVRFCFEVFLQGDTPGIFSVPLTPVISAPIRDKKHVLPHPRIFRLSHCVSREVGEEVILLSEKVEKDDIELTIFEKNGSWQQSVDFEVHKQYAICFKVPKCESQETSKVAVDVFLQLRRISDGATSECYPFVLMHNKPCQSETSAVMPKKRKLLNKAMEIMQHLQANKEVNVGTSSREIPFQSNSSPLLAPIVVGLDLDEIKLENNGSQCSLNNQQFETRSSKCSSNIPSDILNSLQYPDNRQYSENISSLLYSNQYSLDSSQSVKNNPYPNNSTKYLLTSLVNESNNRQNPENIQQEQCSLDSPHSVLLDTSHSKISTKYSLNSPQFSDIVEYPENDPCFSHISQYSLVSPQLVVPLPEESPQWSSNNPSNLLNTFQYRRNIEQHPKNVKQTTRRSQYCSSNSLPTGSNKLQYPGNIQQQGNGRQTPYSSQFSLDSKLSTGNNSKYLLNGLLNVSNNLDYPRNIQDEEHCSKPSQLLIDSPQFVVLNPSYLGDSLQSSSNNPPNVLNRLQDPGNSERDVKNLDQQSQLPNFQLLNDLDAGSVREENKNNFSMDHANITSGLEMDSDELERITKAFLEQGRSFEVIPGNIF